VLRVAPSLEMRKLEASFRHMVFKMLLARGRIENYSYTNHSLKNAGDSTGFLIGTMS
jgi:hypothetical protein